MNQREQRLLAVFLLVIVVTVTWLGWTRLDAEKLRMSKEAEALNGETANNQSYLDAFSAELTGAKAWMDERLGAPVSSQEADARLLNAIQESAKTSDLPLVNTKFLAPLERGKLRLARYSATVTGSESSIYPWLASFHNPDKLRCISGLTIKPDKEDETIVICEVEFAQWYLPEQEDPA